MTKQEYKYKVKEMLNMCLDPTSDCRDKCDYCDYNCCQDYLCRDALFVIEDLELELKQGKIDVLNEVKKRIYDISPYNPLVRKDDVKRFIDKLIDEVENGNT